MSDQKTLTEVIASLGMTHEKATGLAGKTYSHRILKDGEQVYEGRAGDVWDWLEATGQHPKGEATVSADKIAKAQQRIREGQLDQGTPEGRRRLRSAARGIMRRGDLS